jgi:lipoyl(octanoyl) transferase
VIPLEHRHLGLLDYDSAWALQRELRQRLLLDPEAPDVLLTVEHPPVLTAGKRARPAHLLVPRADLEERGIRVRDIERGGDWTWHGPGQLVGYPIVALRRRRLAVKHFVGALEDAMIELAERVFEAAGLEVALVRRKGHPGAWLDEAGGPRRKLGATGVNIRHGVSLHGLALNLDPEPWGFDYIVPCGLQGVETTSIARLVVERRGDAKALPSVQVAGAWLAECLPGRLEAAARGELSPCSSS